MIKQIRTSKFTRFIAFYLAIMLFVEMTQPMRMYALTGGPAQPEFNSFTPIGTSDMVDLSSGDFNYNIPIMDVGGYPINLAYNSGVTMDQEASWVGLGWDMSVGQIARQVRGLPDDFDGDKMVYENNMRPNTTIGSNFNVFLAPFGVAENVEASVSFGLGVKYNNYNGLGFTTNGGLSFQIADNLSVGMNLESSSTDGVSASPSVSFHSKFTEESKNSLGGSLGVSMNNRKGVESVTMSASYTRTERAAQKGERNAKGDIVSEGDRGQGSSFSAGGGSVSYAPADFTPSKRVAMTSSNVMFNLNLEGAVYGVDPGFKFSGYRNTQGIKNSEKFKIERGFGYENTYNATESDILDFNREKDRTVNKHTLSLPVTNYTHDIYSVQGQGVGGMFRPYRGQVGYVYDNYARDNSNATTLGGEIGLGTGTHWGVDLARTDSKSSTGLWTSNNAALSRTKEKKVNNAPNYEKVFFKNVGGNHVDKDMSQLFYNTLDNPTKLGGYEPISFKIHGGDFSRGTESTFYNKYLNSALPVGNERYITRGVNRLNRNQIIQKITREEAAKYGSPTFSPYTNKKTHKHHTAEVRITKPGGEQYNYGRAAYNIVKKEVTFDVSRKDQPNPGVDCKKGLVNYIPGQDNSANNGRYGDQYFNRITTPAYAHTYLLTSVLSQDYQDIDDVKGPTDGDLGTYTKFSYTNKNAKIPYRWRVPYAENKANYDEGLKSLTKDNKGNYQYGEKELLYINKIETKTHVAIFHLSARKDGYGVKGENGGMDTAESSKMWKLDKISLYSKPEYLAHKDNLEEATPIKEAHFEYDYSLCRNIPNHIEYDPSTETGPGKLTLRKVYFTYQNSKMGKYTPYEFKYGKENDTDRPVGYSIETDLVNNPTYDQKGYDIWGNYKKTADDAGCEIADGLSNPEYPYVDQSSKEKADNDASVWLLQAIKLPSGGTMDLNYESDSYKHVQDRDVMQMFKVVGVGHSLESRSTSNVLYEGLHTNVLYIKLDTPCLDRDEFYQKYVEKLRANPIYFRFLLNMTKPTLSNKHDYVTGYLSLADNFDSDDCNVLEGGQYAALRIKMDGGVNPITKAGWYFGKQYLSNVVYNLTGDEGLDVENVEGVVKSIIDLIPNIVNIFREPNAELIDNRIASRFDPKKAWIRLMCPSQSGKFGGGSRVKEILIKDNWDVMSEHVGNERYSQFYGQQYSYTEKDGVTSSGVATYEPLGGKENPFVEPFYDRSHPETLLGPDTKNYMELPFGECFYPSPKITYGRVTVKNLPREKTEAINNTPTVIKVKKHATGSVVTEFFTSRDYPTISDASIISAKYDNSDLASILNINVKTHLTMAQGFSIHTNDMDGKMKSQWVFAEDQINPISGMEYKYEQLQSGQANKGKLDNEVVTIDSKGKIVKNIVGVDYDVINDFRENISDTTTKGVHFNTEGLPLTLIFVIIPIPIPSYSHHENILRTAVTTKVIHSSGILRETIAYDLGSTVSTKNLAWDADTGDVLVTQTVNEYNDNYYNFNFPAYWAYDGMSQGALNLGMEWDVENIADQNYKLSNAIVASKYLIDGDELWITGQSPIDKKGFKAWVVNVSGSQFNLIDDKGLLIKNARLNKGKFKIIKSGHRNMQTASMANITLMKNPLLDVNGVQRDYIYPGTSDNYGNQNPFSTDNWADFRIVNASAIEYKDEWAAQCECGLPKMVFVGGELKFEYQNLTTTDDPDVIEKRAYNPYRYNILGNWRPVKSYAYLTGRNKEEDPTPRKTGFFKDFRSFYVYNSTAQQWKVLQGSDLDKWTFASEVTQYNPYGQEVENMDALERFSSALYGYNYRFPIAVASNAQYREMAFDGFEDYDFSTCTVKSHFNFLEALETNAVSISGKQSHTGKKSIRLEPNKKAVIAKKIVTCPTPVPDGKTNSVVSVKKVQAKKVNTAKVVKK